MQLNDPNAAAMIQQISLMAASGGGTAGMQKSLMQPGSFQMPQAEATDGNPEGKKHPFVERVEKRAEEATRPA